jgi:hypothetical protein
VPEMNARFEQFLHGYCRQTTSYFMVVTRPKRNLRPGPENMKKSLKAATIPSLPGFTKKT